MDLLFNNFIVITRMVYCVICYLIMLKLLQACHTTMISYLTLVRPRLFFFIVGSVVG